MARSKTNIISFATFTIHKCAFNFMLIYAFKVNWLHSAYVVDIAEEPKNISIFM